MNNGFTIHDIMGHDYLKTGMSREQMDYFVTACASATAKRIRETTFAVGRVHSDKESNRKADKVLADMDNALLTSLIKKE